MSLELISIHIPKTGGKSLQMIMSQAYGNQAVLHLKRKFYKRDSFLVQKELLEQITPDIKVLHGHFMYEEVAFLRQQYPTAKWITFFREPVERVISNHYYFQHRILTEKVLEKQLRFKGEDVISYASRKGAKDKMSKFIAGMDLHKFFFVGTLGHYADDINELARLMEWNVDEIPHAHKNSDLKANYKGHTNEEVNQIREMNQQDVSLFERVLQLKQYQ